MRRNENSVFIAEFLIFLRNLKTERSTLSDTIHVNLYVGSYCCIVKYGKGSVLMTHKGDAINVEQSTSNIRSGAECSDSQSVLILITSKLILKETIVEVTIVCQRNSFNLGTAFPPRKKVRIVLKY